jgi:hypothetical protein
VSRRWTALVVSAALAVHAAAAVARDGKADVSVTRHNLSVSGPGEIRSLTETEICRFCHIPHNPVARDHLWNQPLSQAQYETPTVRSAGGKPVPAPQPDGASRLCLSCHDGTVAIGNRGGGAAGRRGGGFRMTPSSSAHRGTDLSGSHPVSFVVSDRSRDEEDGADIGLRPLAAILAERDVKLDRGGKMQCTSCHDPHDDSNYIPGRTPHFFVGKTTSEVCLACHELR